MYTEKVYIKTVKISLQIFLCIAFGPSGNKSFGSGLRIKSLHFITTKWSSTHRTMWRRSDLMVRRKSLTRVVAWSWVIRSSESDFITSDGSILTLLWKLGKKDFVGACWNTISWPPLITAHLDDSSTTSTNLSCSQMTLGFISSVN